MSARVTAIAPSYSFSLLSSVFEKFRTKKSSVVHEHIFDHDYSDEEQSSHRQLSNFILPAYSR